jgi:transposase InsO family protein
MLSQQYPVRHVCCVLGDARSLDDYQARPGAEPPGNAAIARLTGEWPTSGDRRLTALLRREEFPVHHQRVARLMREMG